MYELRFHGKKRGDIESLPLRVASQPRAGFEHFDDVHEAQAFCHSPYAMLDAFDADYGKFSLACGERPGEWEWVWEFRFDRDAVNHLPIEYRVWREAIFNMEGGKA